MNNVSHAVRPRLIERQDGTVAENTSLASQAGRLLSNLTEHGAAHLAEVESDLLQTSLLLREAIESLSASFIAVSDALQEQGDTVDRMLSGSAMPARSVAGYRRLARAASLTSRNRSVLQSTT